MLARALLLGLTCLVAVACGGGPPTPTATPSTGPSGSPGSSQTPGPSGSSVDEQFCGTIADLETEIGQFEKIKVKAGNAQKLKDQAAAVLAAVDPIASAASVPLAADVNAVRAAANELQSSAENYATSSATDAATKRMKKAVTTLKASVTTLRQAASCAT